MHDKTDLPVYVHILQQGKTIPYASGAFDKGSGMNVHFPRNHDDHDWAYVKKNQSIDQTIAEKIPLVVEINYCSSKDNLITKKTVEGAAGAGMEK